MRKVTLILGLCLVALLVNPARAQVPTAQITGVITDPTQAGIPGATVKLTNQATGIGFNAFVTAEGRYVAQGLPPGQYTITVSATGFKTKLVRDVSLEVAQSARLDIALEVGAVTEQVTVTSEVTLLQAEGAAVGTVATSRELTQIPLNGRSFVQMALLAPGTSDGTSMSYQAYKFGKRAENYVIQANGIRADMTTTTIDGIQTQTYDRNWTSAVYPSVDMLQEVKAETSNYQSEFTGGGGVLLNLVTKSGTNNFHGSAFEFVQNKVFNARNFFLPKNRDKPNEKYNQFGFTVGGPVIKNKTFFFLSYQGLRIRNAFINRTRVPTDLERKGDFSESLARGRLLYDPNTTVVDPSSPSGYTRQPFANNVIPSARINSLATKIAALGYPAPTQALDPVTLINFVKVGVNPDASDQWSGRLDHQLTQKDSLFARWTQDPRKSTSLGILDGTGSTREYNGYSGVLAWNHVYSPRLLSEFRFGFTRWTEWSDTFPSGKVLLGPGTDVPLAGLDRFPEKNRTGLCCFSIGGMASPNFGQRGGGTVENLYQINDKHSLTVGKHTVNFGISLRRYEDWKPLINNNLPSRVFRNDYTGQPFGTNPSKVYEYGYGSFLLGLSAEMSPYLPLYPKEYAYWYQHQLDWFVDDTIRLRRNLTVSVGLRYTYATPLHEKENQMAYFDFTKGQVVYPKDAPDFSQYAQYLPFPYRTDGPDYLYKTGKLNFQPRLSIAWSPDSKTVVRTGYAYYTAFQTLANLVPMSGVPPYIITGQRNVSPIYTADAYKLADPAIDPDLKKGFDHPSLQLGEYDFKAPSVQSWNFEIQRQITKTTVASVGYVGNKSDHIGRVTRPNWPVPGPGALDPRRPYPNIGRIVMVTFDGIGNYHGLQMSVRQTPSRGLSFIGHYTFGKALGTADDLIQIDPSSSGIYPLRNSYEYGPVSISFRHIFRTGFVYELPFGRGKQWMTSVHPVLDTILGGWQFSGILTLQSGQPFTVYGGASLNSEVTNRPNRICDGNLSGSARTLLHDYDTACFAQSPIYTVGNAGRSILTQRGMRNLNLGIDKSFDLHLREGMKLQIRGEMFNASNTPFFAIPNNGCCGSSTMGQITYTQRDARVVQMGAKIVF